MLQNHGCYSSLLVLLILDQPDQFFLEALEGLERVLVSFPIIQAGLRVKRLVLLTHLEFSFSKVQRIVELEIAIAANLELVIVVNVFFKCKGEILHLRVKA